MEEHVFRDMLQKLEIGGALAKLGMKLFGQNHGHSYSVHMQIETLDRFNPHQAMHVGNHVVFPAETTEDLALEVIRKGIKTLMIHEVDESLIYAGKLKWDPHRK